MVMAFIVSDYSIVKAQAESGGNRKVARSEIPKRELRGVWVTTYANLDWPSKKGLSSERQQIEFRALLDSLDKANINAVFVQVRPAADALYPSKLNPWSEFLCGKQGRAPEPYYDPLEFMIRECRERCIEFHAWFNPFRAVCNVDFSDISADHISRQMPEWVFQYGQTVYLNPGLEAAREHFIHSVIEVVKNYDIDGVHFDDYYYPYTITGENIPDAHLRSSEHDPEDWRRENINDLIEKTSLEIKACKPYVKFGVGPFAVWRNRSRDSSGSNTRVGQTAYDNLYSDVKLWVEQGWLDYVSPQLYWDFRHRSANYIELIDWWTRLENEKHLYIGHAAYKMGTIWKDEKEMLDQLRYSRIQRAASGDLMYRAQSFLTNQKGINASLSAGLYRHPSIPPEMPWLKMSAPSAPMVHYEIKNDSLHLSWQKETESDYYLVYHIEKGNLRFYSDADQILLKQRNNEITLPLRQDGGAYVVTALNRLHNESEILSARNVIPTNPSKPK